MSQKYVVVQFVDQAPDEFAMEDWPLHITLLGNFSITEPLEKLQKRLSDYASRTKSYEVTVEGGEQFGPDRNVAVSLIHPDSNIMGMHHELKAIATNLGGVFDDPQYVGDGYRPHATIQKASSLHEGQVVSIDTLTLIDMYPNNDIRQRKVIETYTLSS